MARTWSDLPAAPDKGQHPGAAQAGRWNRIKAKVTLTDLALDVSGKILVALGAGALLATSFQPYAWGLIIVGIVLSATVKAKYWKSFWS